jgi:serine/threonine protein kinase
LSKDAQICSACGLSIREIGEQTTQILEQRNTINYSTDPLIGQVLDSKYQILSRLGEGGMGVVYCAHRVHIGDNVAVKVLHRQYVRDAKAVERFRREARSAALIRHPNVVVIHDFNEAEAKGAPAYIVMELVRGKSLRDLLRDDRTVAPTRAVALMQQICAGVGAGHRQGIVHRDLKPDNVIVTPAEDGAGESVKVLDFGLAKLRDAAIESSLTETGALLGTPSYMPPEQCRGEPLDARSDVYSLGAMLYEMLTGNRPFVAPTVAGIIAKHIYEAPPPFPPNMAISLSLQAACRRALSKNPADRQADAAELSRELQTALASPVVAQHTFTPARAPSATQKSHFLAWLIVAFISILICAVIGAFAIKYVSDRFASPNVNVSNGSDAHAGGANSSDNTGTTQNANSENRSPIAGAQTLLGTWTGAYGVMNSPATLIVNEQKGSKWSGVLEQGGVRVAFIGNIDDSSRRVTFKETQVLSGSGWSLGENSGELSPDRRSMSGTGQDATGAQLGMTYQWSFAKR